MAHSCPRALKYLFYDYLHIIDEWPWKVIQGQRSRSPENMSVNNVKYWCNNQLHSCLFWMLLTKIRLVTSILTFQSHPRSKVIAQNESLHMISYMSVIQTKSVVFEIMAIKTLFDFSRSKVKSWKEVYFQANLDIGISASNDEDLTSESENWNFDLSRSLKVKVKVIINIDLLLLICMYDYHINISNSIGDTATQKSRKFEFDLSGSSKVKFYCTKWKPIHDFLYPYYWTQVRISYRFRVIWQNNSHKLKYGGCELWPL